MLAPKVDIWVESVGVIEWFLLLQNVLTEYLSRLLLFERSVWFKVSIDNDFIPGLELDNLFANFHKVDIKL